MLLVKKLKVRLPLTLLWFQKKKKYLKITWLTYSYFILLMIFTQLGYFIKTKLIKNYILCILD